MLTKVLASAALLVTAVQAIGQAVVINECPNGVQVMNTPAAGGGHKEDPKNLTKSDPKYSQDWTSLTNGDGWSIKLTPCKDDSCAEVLTDVGLLQYEYTVGDNSDMLWYDLSEVNGRPFGTDWSITGTNGCNPNQAAYRYATDDANGMQSCTKDATVTVTLCPGKDTSSSSSDESSAPAYSAPSSTATTAPASYGLPSLSLNLLPTTLLTSATGYANKGVDNVPTSIPSTTTAPVPASSAEEPESYGATVTDVHTAVVTNYITASHEGPAHYADGHFWKPRHQHHAARHHHA